MIKSLEMDLCIIALISIHFREQHKGKAAITTYETRWRIISGRMKRRSNCLVFIFRHWDELPDSADIRSPAHLIGQKPSSRVSVPDPNCIEQGAKVVGGLETGDKEVKLIVHLLRWGRAKAWQMPRNLKAVQELVYQCIWALLGWWRKMACQWMELWSQSRRLWQEKFFITQIACSYPTFWSILQHRLVLMKYPCFLNQTRRLILSKSFALP